MDAARARDLLFGDVALALGAAEAASLARAIEAHWNARDGAGLADALVRDGVLDAAARAAVEAEVARIISRAGGDAAAAVARRGGLDRTLRESFPRGLVEGVPARSPLRTLPPDRYRDFSVVGKGGMGLVYVALDTELNRRIAFKMVRPDPQASRDAAVPETPLHATPPSDDEGGSRAYEEMTVRFLQEAWVTGTMEHPGIVPVYELGRTGAGIPYYTMRYVRGERTLATAIREAGNIDARLALLEPFLKVCDTIAYAHARGIVHRDLKPENIALGEFGEAVVLDWGLAKTRGRPDVLHGAWRARVEELRASTDIQTAAGAMGTAGYISPEAALGKGDEVDERSDVFSLGAILFEVLTGRLPYRFKSFVEYVQHLLDEDPPLAHGTDDAVPEELSRVCARALARKREDRFASAAQVAQAVRRWQTEGRVEQQVAEMLDHARGEIEAARRGTGNTILWHLDRASAACSKALHLRTGSAEALAVAAEIRELRDHGIRERERATRLRTVVAGGFLVLAIASLGALYVARRLSDARAEAEAQTAIARSEAGLRGSEARAARTDAAEARARRAELCAALGAAFLKRGDGAAARIAAARALAISPSPAAWRLLADAEALWTPTLKVLLDVPGAGPVAFGPDGRLYAAAGTDLKVMEGGSGGFGLAFPVGEPLRLLAISPDGERIAAAGKVAHVFRTRDGSRIATLPDASRTSADEAGLLEEQEPTALAFDGTGERLFVGYESGVVADWSVEDAALNGYAGEERPAVTALACTDDYLLVGDASGTVARLDRSRFDRSDSRKLGAGPITQIAPAEEDLVYASTLDHRLAVAEFDAWKVMAEFEVPAGRAKALIFSRDRARIYAATPAGEVYAWSADRREPTRLLPEGPEVEGLALSADGALLAVTSADDAVRVFSLDMRWPPEGPEPSSALATSADGGRTVLARPDATLEAWDNVLGKRIARVPTRAAAATAVAIDGDRVLFAGADGTIALWRIGEGALEAEASMRAPERRVVTAIAPGAVPDEILLGFLDGNVEIWSVRNRRRIAALDGEAWQPVSALRIEGGAIDAWDAKEGAQRSWDLETRAPRPPSPARPPTPTLAGRAPPCQGPLEPWVARDPNVRLIDFENRYGRKLAGAEVVPVPPREYDPLRPRVDPWSD